MKIKKKQRDDILGAIDDLFFKFKARLLGRFFKGPKIYFEAVKSTDPLETLEGVYNYTLHMIHGPGAEPDTEAVAELAEIAGNYIEAQRLKTQSYVLNDIAAATTANEAAKKIKSTLDKATQYIDTLAQTETRNMQAYAEKEGITRVAATVGVEDPTVCKLGVIDDKLCDNCKKLWHQKDLKTPKLYKLSELQEGYNQDWKNPVPTLGPTHPHCRHVLTFIAPNFGFNSEGKIEFISLGFDAYKDQRGE